MVFDLPNSFEQTPLVEKPNVYYDFAIKSKGIDLEIRYSLFSLKEKNNDSARNIAARKLFLSSILFNLSDYFGKRETYSLNKPPLMREFPLESVNREFHAEWGTTATISLRKNSFGKGYKYCTVVMLHKVNNSFAYIYFLYNDLFLMKSDLSRRIFYLLR